MSIFSIAIPVDSATALQAVVSSARPLIGLGIFAALLVVFKPLLAGFLRAALLVISPRRPLQARQAAERAESALMLNRMARQFDATEPGLAAELRSLASRG